MKASFPEFDAALALWQQGRADQALALLETAAAHPQALPDDASAEKIS